MTQSMLALGFKRCKSNAGVYYYHDKKTKALVIAIVYVNDVCFIDTKGSLLLNELKQKFMARCVRLANSKARIKPTAPLSAFDKENSIEFLLDSLHYLYNYYMVCVLLSYAYHVTYHVISCDVTL